MTKETFLKLSELITWSEIRTMEFLKNVPVGTFDHYARDWADWYDWAETQIEIAEYFGDVKTASDFVEAADFAELNI